MKKLITLKTWLMMLCLLIGGGNLWAESIEINTTNSGVTGSYADKTFDVEDVTFGFTQWMKNNNIQAKKSTTNSCYNVDAIPGTIKKITVEQTGTARAIKMYGGTSSKPTTEVTAPSTAATMEFDFTGKNYTYFSMTTPSNAVYINTITVEYETSGGGTTPINSLSISPAAGTYETVQNVTLTAGIKGSTIYYTTDGSTPTTSSAVYTAAIPVTTATTVKALAVKDGSENVQSEATYIIKPAQPSYSVDGAPVSVSSKDFKTSASVSISAADGCTIYYTTDNSNPTINSNVYTDNIAITNTTTIKAIAVDTYGNISSYKTLTLNLFNGAIFDFTNNLYGHSGVSTSSSTTGDIDNGEVFVEDNVNIAWTQNADKTQTRYWDNKGTQEIRIYDGSSFCITVPDGKAITKVAFTGTTNLTPSIGNLTNKEWKGYSNAVTFTNKSSSSALQSIKVTVEDAVINLNAACHDADGMIYGTFSCASAWVVPEDLIVSEVGIDGEGKLVVVSYNKNDIVPANTGVMVSATAGGDYTVTLSNEAGAHPAGVTNALHPSSEAMTGDCKFYRLTMHNKTQIGFWWGAAEGAAFSLAANKAYLAVPKSNAKASFWFEMDDEDAIKSVKADGEAVIYNLAGQRILQMQKGINIVNGKKVMK